jgi:hypothetical protein
MSNSARRAAFKMPVCLNVSLIFRVAAQRGCKGTAKIFCLWRATS